jgi:plasmid stabilization system protein ParE
VRLEFDDEAAEELEAAHDWYQRRSLHAARGFLDEIDAALRLIEGNPLQWPIFEGETRRCLLRRFPYAIIYRVRDDVVKIVAVAHGRRRPGYWRAR